VGRATNKKNVSVLTAIFQVNLGSPILLELRMTEVMVTTGAIRRAKLQSNHHHQQTNIQLFTAGCPSRRPTNTVNALPATIMLSIASQFYPQHTRSN